MTSSKGLRVGVIGVGYGAQVHLPGLQSEGVEVVAVCSRREERVKEAAEKYGIPHAFTDYHQMLEMEGLDAVSVVGPVPLHFEMTMAALDAGKHVLCEKPFTTDQELAHAMWSKAESLGLTHMVGHEFRFTSGRQYVKQLLEEGYIGPLHMALVTLVNGPRRPVQPRPYSARDDVTREGGFLGGLGSHYIDCLRHWFGEVVSVTGMARTHYADRTDPETGQIRQAASDDTFQFVLEFADGGWATMTGTTAAPYGPGGRIEIYGRDGVLITPHVGPGHNPPSHGVVLGAKVGNEGLKELPMPEKHEPFSDDRDDRLMPYRLMAREFIRGIQEGTSPAPNFYDGYKVQQVLDAVRESARTGRRVEIPEG